MQPTRMPSTQPTNIPSPTWFLTCKSS
jgi:hypothetical protein